MVAAHLHYLAAHAVAVHVEPATELAGNVAAPCVSAPAAGAMAATEVASAVASERGALRVMVSMPLVVNPRAGGGAVPLDSIVAALDAVGITARVEHGAAFEDALRVACASGAPVVGVAGGDGSMRSAARLLAGRQTALAVFPTGTLNHFSRSLGVDDIATAARAVAAGRTANVAVAYVDDEPFLNTATFGMYADVVQRRERLRRWVGKWPAALVAFLVAIARYRPMHVRLEVEGEPFERPTALVGVGVGHRSFPVTRVPYRFGVEEELVVSILRARTATGLLASGLRTALGVLSGRPRHEDRDVEIVRTRAFTLASRSRRLGVTLDGEIVRRGERARVALQQKALRVVVGPVHAAAPALRAAHQRGFRILVGKIRGFFAGCAGAAPITVLSPDAGGVKRASAFRTSLA